MKRLTTLIFSLLMLGTSAQDIFACRCGIKAPACYAYGEYDAVFVGTVKKVEKKEGTFSESVEVEVNENFKGMDSKIAYTTNSETSCSFRYKVGDKFLFYGSLDKKEKHHFDSYLCSPTAGYSDDSPDIEFLRSLKRDPTSSWVWGSVVQKRDYRDYVPLSGIRVEIFDEKNKLIGTSDSNGDLKMRVSKAGTYKVIAYPPKGTFLEFVERSGDPLYFKYMFDVLKDYNFKKSKPFVEYQVEAKADQCGWFYLSIDYFKKS